MKAATVQLGEVCEFVRGITFPSGEGKPVPFDNSIACLTTSGVQEDVAWDSRRFVQRTRVGNPKQMLQVGDILISTANSKNLVGKSCLVHQPPFPCTFGAFVTVARPQASLYPPYLAYWMTTRKYLAWCFKQSSNTTNISNLRVSELEEIRFSLPDLSEQRRIAGELEQADRLRRTRRYALELTNTFLPAVFLELFGDAAHRVASFDLVAIGDIADRVVVGHVGETTEYYRDSGVAFLRTQNVRRMFIAREGIQCVTPEFARHNRKSSLRSGDVLVSRVGANRGMAAVVPTDLHGANCANILIVTPGNQLDPQYLAFLINSHQGLTELTGDSVGSAQGVINTRTLQTWRIPLPPLQLQQKFAALVERVEGLRAAQREALRQAKHLFASLLDRAFSN